LRKAAEQETRLADRRDDADRVLARLQRAEACARDHPGPEADAALANARACAGRARESLAEAERGVETWRTVLPALTAINGASPRPRGRPRGGHHPADRTAALHAWILLAQSAARGGKTLSQRAAVRKAVDGYVASLGPTANKVDWSKMDERVLRLVRGR
jgi:hypothetical protein